MRLAGSILQTKKAFFECTGGTKFRQIEEKSIYCHFMNSGLYNTVVSRFVKAKYRLEIYTFSMPSKFGTLYQDNREVVNDPYLKHYLSNKNQTIKKLILQVFIFHLNLCSVSFFLAFLYKRRVSHHFVVLDMECCITELLSPLIFFARKTERNKWKKVRGNVVILLRFILDGSLLFSFARFPHYSCSWEVA